MWARDLAPQPRCTFIGEDEAGTISRCGRWFGHPGHHESKQHVLDAMAQAIAATKGWDTQRTIDFHTLVIARNAIVWYHRLVKE